MRLSTRIKKVRALARRWIRSLRRPRNQTRLAIGLGVAAIAIIVIPTMNNDPINPAAYQPLLRVIAKGESGGNYNAYFGNVSNTSLRFTDMTIDEVLAWQDAYIKQGAASNAVGRYQFMGTTLRGLIKEKHIKTTAKFDESMQDRLARALIDRRGALKFVRKKITVEQFATNLSMEWAALPSMQGPNAGQSYYAGDGLNSAQVTSAEVRDAIEAFRLSQ